MRLHDDYSKRMSSASLRQRSGVGRAVYLNDTLNAQSFYIELEIKDPDGGLVCEANLSYEQFVRLLLFNGDIPITLEKYRNSEGKLVEEVVEKPKAIDDAMLEELSENVSSIQNRITDLRRDLYELQNSGKSVGKKQLSELLEQVKVIESHYKGNIPYVTKVAANKVGEIQDNAKSQLAIAANQLFGTDKFEPENFHKMICSDSYLALPDPDAKPVEDNYELKEREEKPIDNMTNIEVGDALNRRLKQFERAEKKYFEGHPAKDPSKDYRTRLFGSNASSAAKGKVSVCYISYQHGRDIDLELAKRYLKFLLSINKYSQFKEHYIFEKEEK